MVTICQKCGDKGFSVALIYCDECQVYAIHRYCLDVLPKTFDEYVVWLCVDCESKLVKSSTVDKASPLLIRKNDSESLESVQVKKSNHVGRLKKKSKRRKVSTWSSKSKRRKASTHSLTKLEVLKLKSCSCHQLIEVQCSGNVEKDQELGRENGLDDRTFDDAAESLESKNSQPVLHGLHYVKLDCCENSEKNRKVVGNNRLDEGSSREEAESLETKNSQLSICGLQPVEVNKCEEGEKNQMFERQNGLDEFGSHEEAESLETKNRQLAICDPQPLELYCYNNGKKHQKLKRQTVLNEDSFDEEAKSCKTKNDLDEGRLHKAAESLKTKNSHLAIYGLQPLKVDYCDYGENNQKVGRWNGLDEVCFDEETISDKTENNQLAISDTPIIAEQGCYVPARPIKDPIWRGSLNILNKNFGTVSGLVAHLSNIACARAREEARSLAGLLSPELLPRSAVWPKGFEKWGPSDDSIALYFFPDNERDEKVFDGFVNEMISQELAMRVVVENAELLIFTSTILPMEYWRFQAKFYLWGVFRGKRCSHAAIDVVPKEEEGLTKAITWDVHSPVSILSNGIYGSGSIYSPCGRSLL